MANPYGRASQEGSAGGLSYRERVAKELQAQKEIQAGKKVRVKHVMTEDGVAHAFVHQTQDSARKSSRNFSFDQTELYSYSTCIAKYVENHKKQKALLVTTRHYSCTTASQMSTLRRAIPDNFTVFYVPNVNQFYGTIKDQRHRHLENFNNFLAEIRGLQEDLKKAKNRAGQIVRQIREQVKTANEYAKFFGLPQRARITNAKTLAKLEKHGDELSARWEAGRESRYAKKRKADAARWAARDAEFAKQRAEREEQRKKDLLEAPAKLVKWLQGESNEFPCVLNEALDDPIYLRKLGGTRIQTSLGAEIPYNAGKALFNKVLEIRENKAEYKDDQYAVENSGPGVISAVPKHKLEVGGFPVEEITVQGDLKAGCHFIQWPQIEDFARREGWIK